MHETTLNKINIITDVAVEKIKRISNMFDQENINKPPSHTCAPYLHLI